MSQISLDVSAEVLAQFDAVIQFDERNRAGAIRTLMKQHVNTFKDEHPKKWDAYLEFAKGHLDFEDVQLLTEEL